MFGEMLLQLVKVYGSDLIAYALERIKAEPQTDWTPALLDKVVEEFRSRIHANDEEFRE